MGQRLVGLGQQCGRVEDAAEEDQRGEDEGLGEGDVVELLGAVMPLRATDREEAMGMDVVQHGEEAYVTGEGAILLLPDDHEKVAVPVADPG